jgi:hypothetical protein
VVGSAVHDLRARSNCYGVHLDSTCEKITLAS